jgi:hypothetical protein
LTEAGPDLKRMRSAATGLLPDEEHRALEERLEQDPGLVQELGPDLKRMRAYVSGLLTDEEHRAFEERLEQDPDLVQELEQLLRFREGLEILRQRGYFSKAHSRNRVLRMWVPAFAACLVAAIGLFLWQRQDGGPAPALTASIGKDTVLVPVTEHFTFLATRGGATPDLYSPGSGLLEFRIRPSAAAATSRYRVTLTYTDEEPAKPIGTLSHLAVADGYVYAYADASRLSPGSYVLRIEAESTTDTTHEPPFPFNLHTR